MIEPTIRKDEPVPDRPVGRPRSNKWAFLYDLDIGESAHFDYDQFEDDEAMKKFRSYLSSNAYNHAKRYDKKFTVRTTDTGVGVWRVE